MPILRRIAGEPLAEARGHPPSPPPRTRARAHPRTRARPILSSLPVRPFKQNKVHGCGPRPVVGAQSAKRAHSACAQHCAFPRSPLPQHHSVAPPLPPLTDPAAEVAARMYSSFLFSLKVPHFSVTQKIRHDLGMTWENDEEAEAEAEASGQRPRGRMSPQRQQPRSVDERASPPPKMGRAGLARSPFRSPSPSKQRRLCRTLNPHARRRRKEARAAAVMYATA